MKKMWIVALMIPVILSCNEVTPPGYYNAKIAGEACTLIAQVRGGKDVKELDKYDYIDIINIPQNLRYVGAEFYFKTYQISTEPVFCNLTNSSLPPSLRIEINEISTGKPK